MSRSNNGGPAFPRTGFLSSLEGNTAIAYDNYPQDGMSLRDWFAGQALAGIMAGGSDTSNAVEWAPEEAYAVADAMLAARMEGGK